MVCGMNEEDIEEMLSYNYWPCVLIDTDKGVFIARLYKYIKRNKKWRLMKTRRFKTALEAWDYLRETLLNTLKFIR